MIVDDTGGTNALTERYQVEITPTPGDRVRVRVRRSWDGHALTAYSPASLTSDMIGVLIEDHRERAHVDLPEPKTLDFALQVAGSSITQRWTVEELDHRPHAPDDHGAVQPRIPLSALAFLGEILREAKRRMVTVISMDAELTIEQAADYLKVSPAHVTQLLEEGRLSSRQAKVGRVIPFRGIVEYQRQTETGAASEAVPQTVADNAVEPHQDLGPPGEQPKERSRGST